MGAHLELASKCIHLCGKLIFRTLSSSRSDSCSGCVCQHSSPTLKFLSMTNATCLTVGRFVLNNLPCVWPWEVENQDESHGMKEVDTTSQDQVDEPVAWGVASYRSLLNKHLVPGIDSMDAGVFDGCVCQRLFSIYQRLFFARSEHDPMQQGTNLPGSTHANIFVTRCTDPSQKCMSLFPSAGPVCLNVMYILHMMSRFYSRTECDLPNRRINGYFSSVPNSCFLYPMESISRTHATFISLFDTFKILFEWRRAIHQQRVGT